MCGIAGFILASQSEQDAALRALTPMTTAIRHRGPDDEGTWYDSESRVGLGHRRLSILDLSKAGHQPMWSASGRYIVAFNGEIYNHIEIRQMLERGSAIAWRGHSDTETLLAAIDAWGLHAALERCTGMFAIALWDRQEHVLHLARDRMGEKPLYYGWSNGSFIFASELKALHIFPGFVPDIDRDALGLYMAFNCVPAPWSIYRGIYKLLPGRFISISAGSGPADALRETTYWSLAEKMKGPRFTGTPEEAAGELEQLLSRAVSLQSIADVPLGCFLSGGIDSSLITALMQTHSNHPVRTFAIGFQDKAFDESPYAAAIAKHLGTNHVEYVLTSGEALYIIPNIPDIWDEPFADRSQIPTACVAALARRQVTVSLSGDGGDELFAGYPRYAVARGYERLPAKSALSIALGAAPLGAIAAVAQRFHPMADITEHRLRRLAAVLRPTTREQRYLNWQSYWSRPDRIVPGATQSVDAITGFRAPPALDDVTAISALDAVTYLPNDILAKVDRAAMTVSLETRVPLLDHHVVEFAYSLPIGHKMRGGQSKWPLRRILEKYVPHTLTDRPKKGFGVPLQAWLRGPLREWSEDLLAKDCLQRSGLNPDVVAGLWSNLQSEVPAPDIEPKVWAVLMYQAWFARHADSRDGVNQTVP
jgi:asparagine synthase (glutamine-hydrolysing)